MSSSDEDVLCQPEYDSTDDVDEESFNSMLEEMEQRLSREVDSADFSETGDTDEITEDLDEDDISRDAAIAYEQARRVEETATQETGPLDQTGTIRVPAFPTNATLMAQFSVQVAGGQGNFIATAAQGQLSGSNSYPFRVLDDFDFGFNPHRNTYEIVLDQTSAAVELKEFRGDGEFTLLCDKDGQIKVNKPAGVRLDVYRIVRTPAGAQNSTKITSSPTLEPDLVILPTDPAARLVEYSEFMLGFGLTDEDLLCYAFSVYLAVKLDRPLPPSEEE